MFKPKSEKSNLYAGKGKFFDAMPKDALFIRRVSEDSWFKEYQPLLLAMANTRVGRDLLCIDQSYGRITRFRKNEVQVQLTPWRKGKDGIFLAEFASDFRVGAKWANVIRYRWNDFCGLAEDMLERLEAERLFNGIIASPFMRAGACVTAGGRVSFASITKYPDPNVETTTCDGMIARASVDETFATIKAAVGSSPYPSLSSGNVGLYPSATTNQYSQIRRTFFGFDTSSLGIGANISDAKISLFGDGGSSFSQLGDCYLTIVSATPASNTDLVNNDLPNVGTTKLITDVNVTSWNASDYNELTYNNDGKSAVSLTGVSNFGSRFIWDLSGSPTWAGTKTAISGGSKFAETSGTTNDPKLVVTYTAAATFVPKFIAFG